MTAKVVVAMVVAVMTLFEHERIGSWRWASFDSTL